MARKKVQKIVTVGGGNGQATLTGDLKDVTVDSGEEVVVTAIVAVTDDGSHTGELRSTRGIAAIGDARNVITALMPSNPNPKSRSAIGKRVVGHRFGYHKGSNLNKRAFGNFMLLALMETNGGDLAGAIEDACILLETKGTVLPVSTDNVKLCAELRKQGIIEGESRIDKLPLDNETPVQRIFLKPSAKLHPPVRNALMEADKIVFCAGSPWTSLAPNLVVEGFIDAVNASNAQLLQVINIVSYAGESKGLEAHHLAKITSDSLGRKLDCVICNNGALPEKAIDYFAKGARLVYCDEDLIKYYADEVIQENLVHWTGSKVVHGPALAKLIVNL